jgi:hypothetical protein
MSYEGQGSYPYEEIKDYSGSMMGGASSFNHYMGGTSTPGGNYPVHLP